MYYLSFFINITIPRKRKILQEERSKRTRRTRVLGERKSRKPIIYNNDVWNFFCHFNEKSNSKTIKRLQNLKTDFFRGNPHFQRTSHINSRSYNILSSRTFNMRGTIYILSLGNTEYSQVLPDICTEKFDIFDYNHL